MKSGAHIHVPLGINCDNYGDPLIFYLAPSSVQDLNLFHCMEAHRGLY